MNILDQIMGVQEAAELWGLSPDHIKRLCRDGKVIARNIGKTWIIVKDQPNPKGGNNMVNFEGKVYRLVQDAYIDGIAGERPHYKASAVDAEGNEYTVIWDVVDHWQDIEDESDMCDWDNPADVRPL